MWTGPYIDSSAREAGTAAEIAATRKTAKYSNLSPPQLHTFYPIAVESLGALNEDARLLLSDLGRQISAACGDVRDVSFLFQRISVCCATTVLLKTTSRNSAILL